MNTYTVTRTVLFVFKVEAVDKDDALHHAMENIDSIEEATTTNVFEEWMVD